MSDLSHETKLSVKVRILDRTYPLNISAEEETLVMKASELVNEKLSEFKGSFSLDKQDLLALSAISFAIDSLKNNRNNIAPSNYSDINLDNIESSILQQLQQLEEKMTGIS